MYGNCKQMMSVTVPVDCNLQLCYEKYKRASSIPLCIKGDIIHNTENWTCCTELSWRLFPYSPLESPLRGRGSKANANVGFY